MNIYDIPFNRAYTTGNEVAHMQQAMQQGHISGDGPYTRRCQAQLEQITSAHRALLTTSCTHALEMAALLLDIKPGDEIIVPSFTFVSTVNAFVLRGARPVFIDIRPDTLNLDENLLLDKITPRTRAIVAVHYAGVGCEMDSICQTASRHNIPVVEDNAHGLFGQYKGRPLGSFGLLGTQSFHETKNFSCGEGGALLINDPGLVERAEIIREKGTDRSRFFRGQVDKYTWTDIGSSYVLSDLLAAFLWAQLEAWQEIQQHRQRIWEMYDDELSGWAGHTGVKRPTIPEHCQQPYHMYYLLMPTLESRQRLIAHLKSRRILSVFHYLPLHLSPMGKHFAGMPGDAPVTEDISDRLLRLPMYAGMLPEEQQRVLEAITAFIP